MRINEIFYTIQGESSLAGYPCVMIRLSGCNLDCTWCDTDRATQVNLKLTPQEVINRILPYKHCGLIELTGGEPLLQPESPALLKMLLADGWQVLLETNGSQDISQVPAKVKRIVDVKCPGSGQGNSFLTANLKHLIPGQDELKFVLAHQDDYNFAKGFLAKVPTGVQVHFSPVLPGLKPSLLASWVLADQLSVRLQLQAHKFIWPAGEPKDFAVDENT